MKKVSLFLLLIGCVLLLTACGNNEKRLVGDWDGRKGNSISNIWIKEDGYFTMLFDEDPTDNTMGSVHYTGHLRDGKLQLETREWSYTPRSNPVAKPYEEGTVLEVKMVSDNIIEVEGNTFDRTEKDSK